MKLKKQTNDCNEKSKLQCENTELMSCNKINNSYLYLLIRFFSTTTCRVLAIL